MAEMVQIRSVKQYFNDFIAGPLQKHESVNIQTNAKLIKSQILDAFRKEIFGQVAFKCGPEVAKMTRDEMGSLEPVQNILQNSFRKWRRFCMLCNEAGIYYFSLEDLADALLDEDEKEQKLAESASDASFSPPKAVVKPKKSVELHPEPADDIQNSEELETATSGYVDILKEEPSNGPSVVILPEEEGEVTDFSPEDVVLLENESKAAGTNEDQCKNEDGKHV